MAELTEEEGKQLIAAFNKLKVKPKCDTSEDLKTWLTAYGSVTVKPDPAEKVSVSPQYPRISLFYGDNTKGEVPYQQWIYEIKCLLFEKTYKPEIILQAVRRSVRGEAANLLRRLGTGASISQIIDKFESVYGEVDTKEHLLAKFYSAKQEESEDITKWSCRLEDILSNAVDRGIVDSSKVNEMLRNMFWQGLKPDLKDISGYLFDKIKDFDQLRVEIKKLEQDHTGSASNTLPCKSVTGDKSEMQEMKTMIQSLNNSVKELEKKISVPVEQMTYQNNNQRRKNKSNRGYHQGGFGQNNARPYQGPIRFNNPGYSNKGKFQRQQNYPMQNQASGFNNFPVNSQFQGQGQNQFQDQNQFQGQGQNQFQDQNQFQGQSQNQFQNQNQFQGQGKNHFQGQSQNQYQGQGQNQFQGQGYAMGQNQFQSQGQSSNQGQAQGQEDIFNRGPLCFNCGQYGHYQWKCPVTRMDHLRKNLNQM